MMAVEDDDEAIALMNDSRLRPHRVDLDERRRRGHSHRRPGRHRHVVPEPLRLSRPGAGVDRRQGLGTRLLAVAARLRGADPPEVVPPPARALSGTDQLTPVLSAPRKSAVGQNNLWLATASSPSRSGTPRPQRLPIQIVTRCARLAPSLR